MKTPVKKTKTVPKNKFNMLEYKYIIESSEIDNM